VILRNTEEAVLIPSSACRGDRGEGKDYYQLYLKVEEQRHSQYLYLTWIQAGHFLTEH